MEPDVVPRANGEHELAQEGKAMERDFFCGFRVGVIHQKSFSGQSHKSYQYIITIVPPGRKLVSIRPVVHRC